MGRLKIFFGLVEGHTNQHYFKSLNAQGVAQWWGEGGRDVGGLI